MEFKIVNFIQYNNWFNLLQLSENTVIIDSQTGYFCMHEILNYDKKEPHLTSTYNPQTGRNAVVAFNFYLVACLPGENIHQCI